MDNTIKGAHINGCYAVVAACLAVGLGVVVSRSSCADNKENGQFQSQGEGMEARLKAINVVPAEPGDNWATMRGLLKTDKYIRMLAEACIRVAGGRSFRETMSLDSIHGRFRDVVAPGTNEKTPIDASYYMNDDYVRQAIVKRWNESHSGPSVSSIEEILR